MSERIPTRSIDRLINSIRRRKMVVRSQNGFNRELKELMLNMQLEVAVAAKQDISNITIDK